MWLLGQPVGGYGLSGVHVVGWIELKSWFSMKSGAVGRLRQRRMMNAMMAVMAMADAGVRNGLWWGNHGVVHVTSVSAMMMAVTKQRANNVPVLVLL